MKKNLILIALFCVGALSAENYGLWFNETQMTDANGTVVQTCDAAQNEQISIAGLNANTVYLLVVTLEDGRVFSKQFMKR